MKETGSIDKVVLNLSINADPASGETENLWDAIAADEGTWYQEPQDPEIPPISTYIDEKMCIRDRFSTDPAHVKKSQIEANVFAETEIKNRHNTDPDKLETPITLDYGCLLYTSWMPRWVMAATPVPC